MKIVSMLVLTLALAGCADGPSPRQKYGALYGVTGTNVPKKDAIDGTDGVSYYSRNTLERMQSLGSGFVPGVAP
jgi:hypothetical protein